jgi:hypothetical protein
LGTPSRVLTAQKATPAPSHHRPGRRTAATVRRPTTGSWTAHTEPAASPIPIAKWSIWPGSQKRPLLSKDGSKAYSEIRQITPSA